MGDLFELYTSIQSEIDTRLGEFHALWERGTDSELFRELSFCTCTPQTNARYAWNAVCHLSAAQDVMPEAALGTARQAAQHSEALESGSRAEIAAGLRESGVRFHNNKAAYITANRERFFPDTKSKINRVLQSGDIISARATLVRQIAGWGMKEASHFLRNTGHGDAVCILDRHILRQLVGYGVIPALPASLTMQVYLEIEAAMMEFARKEGIPVDALDLVFWFKAKGELFR